jgi:hypothetical protein
MIKIETDGNKLVNSATVDCYRFVLRNIALYTTGTGDVINIIATNNTFIVNNTKINTNPDKISPRHGILENLIISHHNSLPGHSIKIAGGAYIRMERMAITGGKGILLATTAIEGTYQEFIWMRQIALNAHPNKLYANPSSCIDSAGGSGHHSISDSNTAVQNSRFLNFRLPTNNTILGCTLKVGNQNNELNFANLKKSDTISNASVNGLIYTITLVPFGPYTINSPFPAKPVAIVSTNQKIPFKVTTTNTNGGASQLQVEFSSAPTTPVYISYYLTGFYYS